MTAVTGTSRSPMTFFALVFLISLPFWLADLVIGRFLPDNLPLKLPISALQAVNPMLVAMFLTYRDRGGEGIRALFRRSLDWRRLTGRWLIPIFLFMPVVLLLEYVLRIVTGNPIPDPEVPIVLAPAMFAVFLLFAIGEEAGWQGYAYEPMRARWNALGAALIMGTIWAVWHVIPLLHVGRPLPWLLWHLVGTIGLRVIIVWLYNGTGRSVLAAILFHAMINVSEFMYPNFGSYYDPFVATLLILIAATAVLARTGPTLAEAEHRAA